MTSSRMGINKPESNRRPLYPGNPPKVKFGYNNSPSPEQIEVDNFSDSSSTKRRKKLQRKDARRERR